jgi:hypothetical protein
VEIDYNFSVLTMRASFKKQKKSSKDENLNVYTFYCIQLKGEQMKKKLISNTSKQHAHITMDCFKCQGWLHITLDDKVPDMAVI